MSKYRLPYGKTHLTFTLPENYCIEVIAPPQVVAADDPRAVVERALENPVGGVSLDDFTGVRSAAIAISDKTRPVPHQHLLPPLLQRLEALGLAPEAITLLIATGTHPSMSPSEFSTILPETLIHKYRIICHDTDRDQDLVYLGETQRGTSVWINRFYLDADLHLVVGNIEPHQFQGFSGGVKIAAIGLAGRATVNHNHAMMVADMARLGEFDRNPTRQDVEEIGSMLGVQFALNAILNNRKEIVHVIAGAGGAVLQAGIPLARKYCQVEVDSPYDMLVVSPGGHPKDINLYQSQKGFAHACLIARQGAIVILAAACPDGTGSRAYEVWMAERRPTTYAEIIDHFQREGFHLGPHKAYQIARDASKVQLRFLSELDPDFAQRLLLNPVDDLQAAVDAALAGLDSQARIGVMPRAASTIPYVAEVGPES